MPSDCVYLRKELTNKTTEDGRQVHECQVHTFCTKVGDNNPYASCANCKEFLEQTKIDGTNYKDQLVITDRDHHRTHALRDMLAGRSTFLVCGGPSLKQQPMELLQQRGIWSIGVNNVVGKYRTNAFVCSDPPKKFHNGIWQDPTIMKFFPTPKLTAKHRGHLSVKVGEEFQRLNLKETDQSTQDMPNVWGFERRSWLRPDISFFLEPDAAWGNHNSGVDQTGEEKTVCTMLLALRLLYYLGSRRIYLLGVDFWMDPLAALKNNYAFEQERELKAVDSNNHQFSIVDGWLCRMQEDGVFDQMGMEIYNCNEMSGLRAFPYVPLEEAVEEALHEFPESPFDLSGWYNQGEKK